MLGKLPVLGRPTNLDESRAGAYRVCSRCGRGCLDICSRLSFLFSLSLSLSLSLFLEDGPIETEIMSQRAVKPKSTNHLGVYPYTFSLFVQTPLK